MCVFVCAQYMMEVYMEYIHIIVFECLVLGQNLDRYVLKYLVFYSHINTGITVLISYVYLAWTQSLQGNTVWNTITALT